MGCSRDSGAVSGNHGKLEASVRALWLANYLAQTRFSIPLLLWTT